MMITVDVLIVRVQSQYVRNQLIESGRTILNQFVTSARLALRSGDDVLLLNAAKAAFHPDAGIKSVFLLNGRHEIQVHQKTNKIGEQFSGSLNGPYTLSRELQIEEVGLFTAVIKLKQSTVNQSIWAIQDQIIGASLLTIAIGIMGAGILSGFLVEPIEDLTDTVTSIARGDYGRQITIQRKDEIGTLATSINEMSQKILEDRRELIEKQKLESELEVGREIQRRLLIDDFPTVDNYQSSVEYRSAKMVGGDLYDALRIDSDRIAFFLADASGKGVPGALLMTNTISSLRSIFRFQSNGRNELEKGLAQLNDIIRAHTDNKSFVSLFAAILDWRHNELQFARCGHNPLLYREEAAGTVHRLEPDGIAVGVEPRQVFLERTEIQRLSLSTGDTVFEYSDGIIDLKNDDGKRLGIEGFRGLLESITSSDLNASDIVDRILFSDERSNGYEPEDDIVLMTLERTV
jgi:serine phosphatase RsbU (regulator of sigma subunit)